MDNIYTEFGKRFKELREANRMTQDQLAECIGVEARQISRIETGKCFTTLDNLKKISSIFDVEIKDMFNFSHFKEKNELIKMVTIMLENASEEDCRKIFKIIKELLY